MDRIAIPVINNTMRAHEFVSERKRAKKLKELSFLGSPCTKDCSGHRAGYEWFKRNQRSPASWSQSFNNGANLAQQGK